MEIWKATDVGTGAEFYAKKLSTLIEKLSLVDGTVRNRWSSRGKENYVVLNNRYKFEKVLVL